MASSGNRTQRVFVIAEMALALVLLVGSGLMIHTLLVLWQLDPGFNPRGVMTFSIAPQASLAKQPAAAVRAFVRRVREQLASTGGIKAVSLSAASVPMQDDYDWHIWFAGHPKPAHLGDFPMALVYIVEPDYLNTLQLSLARGRFLEASDGEHSPAVAVIDDTLARKYFRGQDPIGQYIDLGNDPGNAGRWPLARVVGIVKHINQWGLGSDDTNRPLQAQIYLPIDQMPDHIVHYMTHVLVAHVRAETAAPPNFEALRTRLQSVNRELVAYAGEPMERVVLRTIAGKRFTMALLAVFAALALLLASIGIYGVLSYLVGQRTREIGIRMALGAARQDVVRMILTDGVRMTATGAAIGIVAALALTRFMSSVLFGVSPTDLGTFFLVVLILCSISMLACYLPARRAMKIDPLTALRDD